MTSSAQEKEAWAHDSHHFSARRGFSLLVGYGCVALAERVVRPRLQKRLDRASEKGHDADSFARTEVKVRAHEASALGFAKAVALDFSKHRIMALAAEITFYSLLALFPAVAALVSLYGLFANPGAIAANLKGMSGVLPGGAISLIDGQIASLAKSSGNSLSLGFVAGLAVALWSANSGMKSVFDALNVVFELQEARGFFKLNLITLSLTCGVILLLIFALAGMIVVPILTAFVNGAGWTGIVSLARWPAMLVFVYAIISVLYRVGPSKPLGGARWVTAGAVFASGAWLGASMLFSWYVANFGSYNKTYGSLGAAVGFMTWMWISAMIVLIGAVINAELERARSNRTFAA